MSILKFFVRAIAVVPDELTKYISLERGIKSSITSNRGAVCTKKMPVRMSGDIRLETKENISKQVSKPISKEVIDDGPII